MRTPGPKATLAPLLVTPLLVMATGCGAQPPLPAGPLAPVGPARAYDAMQVFVNHLPEHPFTRRGVVDSPAHILSVADPATMLAELTARAAQAGCDGVLVNTGALLFNGVGEPDQIGLLAVLEGDGKVHVTGFRGACIQLGGARPPAPPAPVR